MRRLLLCLMFGFASTTFAFAGTTGNLGGFVRDEVGQPIHGAVVKLVSPTFVRVATTNLSGYYQFMALDPGPATLAIERDGFYPQVHLVTIVSDTSGRIITKMPPAMNIDFVRSVWRQRDELVPDRTLDSYIVPNYLLESQIP